MDESCNHSINAEELQRYRLLAKYNRDVILFVDLKGRILEANEAAVNTYGYTREELLKLTIYDLRADSDRSIPVKHDPEGVLFEIVHRRRDGTTFPIEASSQVVRVGSREKVITVIRDITSHKEAQQELRRSEEQYRILFARNPNPMWVFDEETLGFLAVNDAAVRHYGWSREEFLRMSVLDVRPAEDRDLARSTITQQHGVREESVGVFRHCRKDGAVMQMEITVSSIQFEGRPGRLCTMKDVTELRRAMDALQQTKNLLSGIIDSTSDLISAFDLDYRIVAFNQAYADECRSVIGCELKIGVSLPEVLAEIPADRSAIMELLEHARKGENVLAVIGYGENPVRRFYEMRASPIFGAGGRVVGIAQIARNVTERRKAEEELRISEEKFAAAFATNPAAISVTRLEDRVLLDVNETWLALTGYKRDEAIGRDVIDLNVWPNKSDRERFIDELMKTGSVRMEQEFRKKSGETFFAQISGQTLNIRGVPAILTTLVDITERIFAERALRQANENLETRIHQRTQALTESLIALNRRTKQLQILASELTMAEQRERWRLAQVLHDGLQQLLVSASMRTAMLARTDNPDVHRRSQEILDLLTQSIEVARSLTAELSPPVLHEGGLVPALEWLARWMQDRQGLSVDLQAEVETEEIPEDVTILLFQATRELLFNIVKHAGVNQARVFVEQRQNTILVSVVDHGAGFDPQAIENRSGPTGGFGLFSIRERLGLLGGRMEIASAPGHGSRFTMHLPIVGQREQQRLASPREPSRVAVAINQPEAVATERIRVMLVDDHLVMRQGLRALFRDEPEIDVIAEASDGETAVRLAREIRPDVILMDVSMPRMNGVEATQTIHREMPDVRIIGLSMYDEADRGEAMRNAGAVHYLTKTEPSENLISAVRTCMR